MVCLTGVGPHNAHGMVIGEAPGWREEDERKPFAGKSGKLLDKVLLGVGLKREEVFVTNIVACRPPNNRTPEPDEIEACNEYLMKQIETVKPKYILALGGSAVQTLTGRRSIKISKIQDSVVPGPNGSQVIASYHPAYILRKPVYHKNLVNSIARFARMLDTKPQKEVKTYAVLRLSVLEKLIKKLKKYPHISVDLETEGLDPTDPTKRIWCIGLAVESGISYVVPLQHPGHLWNNLPKVYSLLKDLLESKPLIGQNIKFDLKWLWARGIKGKAVFDCLVASYLLDENRAHDLENLAIGYLGVSPWKIPHSKELYPLKILIPYNGKDANYALQLYPILRNELLKDKGLSRVFGHLLMPITNLLTEMEMVGMPIDRKRLEERTKAKEDEASKLLEKLIGLAGEEVNWRSYPQVGRILFDKLKLPVLELTEKGGRCVNESVLLRLKSRHPIVQTLLDYRTAVDSLSKFLYPWEVFSRIDSKIHTTFKQFKSSTGGTTTGRLSSSDPNLQQVPRDKFYRTIFGGLEDYYVVAADYSQIEMRIAAHESGDVNLKRAFLNGDDVHMNMAIRVIGKPKELISEEERKKAKSVNFGYLFSMGWQTYIEYARDKYQIVVSEAEAKISRRDFFAMWPMLADWHKLQRKRVHAFHQVRSLIGRVRHLPNVLSSDKEAVSESERQAINSPVQSLASDFTLLSLIEIDKVIKENGWDWIWAVCLIHDAILFMVRKDHLDEGCQLIYDKMVGITQVIRDKFKANFSVPIEVEIKYADHFGEGKVWKPIA